MDQIQEIKISELSLDAEWKDDCQGKKDFDGNILLLSTRFYSESYHLRWPAKRKMASAASGLYFAAKINDESEWITLYKKEFEGATDSEVKKAVEDWTKSVFQEISQVVIDHFKSKLRA